MLVLLRGQYKVQLPVRKTQQHRAFIPFFLRTQAHTYQASRLLQLRNRKRSLFICTRLLRKSRHSLRSALCLSAKLPTQAWSRAPCWLLLRLADVSPPTLVKAQQTGFPKMFLKKTFWDVLIARLFRFFTYPKFPPIK